MEKNKILSIENESKWKNDQSTIKNVLTILNRSFGSNPNATGLDYLKQFDIEWTKVKPNLYASTNNKLLRIREDAELWMKNIHQNRWMQAEDYLTKIISYTTYIYTL